MEQIEIVADLKMLTGESPMWSTREAALYWLDTRSDTIFRRDVSGGIRRWTTPAKVNALGLAPAGLIVGMKGSVALFDLQSGVFTHLIDPAPGRTELRLNDGKVDRAGRFWFSTMEDNAGAAIGSIYQLAGTSLTLIDEEFTIPNGFAWSPDDSTMYLADSKLGCIYAYDFSLADGAAKNRRVFSDVPNVGNPDGATADAQGFVWSARPGEWSVVRLDREGNVDRVVRLPVQRPTSVIFGGDDLRTLFVTSGTRGLSPEQLAGQPHAGALLAVEVDVPGLPEPEFA
jgi:L-arabinonolactonase